MKFAIWLPAFVLVVLTVVASAQVAPPSAHQHAFTSIDEEGEITLSGLAGKAVLVVNTASFCGFTHQYEGLEALWREYRDEGLVVLGVPSNDFGAQEPHAEAEIKAFCQGAFNVTFPLTRKYKVRGEGAHGFYRWLADVTGGQGSPRWNFHKVLLDGDGRLVRWFPSSVAPQAPKLRRAVQELLGEAQAGGSG
ncbi:MAG: glutathione peroxidase [Pseudomonadota bacterium]